MVDGQTQAPPLLTEADLITLMDKHGIGKDIYPGYSSTYNVDICPHVQH